MENNKKKVWIHKTIVLLCSLLIVGTIVLIYNVTTHHYAMQQQQAAVTENVASYGGEVEAKAAMSQDEMEQAIASHRTTSAEKEAATEAEGTDGDTLEETVIDFAGLQELNPDVYAWISVPGTKIEYPILQHPTDDTYYLNYNIDGSYGYPGCIYTEKANAKDFSDPNTVIYGHNMKNGTMFAGLHQFEDRDFFDKNQEVIIYTPDKTYHYRIFASYIYDDRHLLYSFDFHEKAVFETYLSEIYARRDMSTNLNEDITVTGEDKIITLVTCMGKQPDKRLLVQAVLEY